MIINPKELEAEIQRDICTSTFIAALFTIAKKMEATQCPSMDKSDIYIYLYRTIFIIYIYIERELLFRKEILIHSQTWMKLKDIC